MDFQIRIRTNDDFKDLHYIEQWLAETTSGFAFNHDLPDNNHYHIYLFGLQRNPDAMRRHLGKHLAQKVDYAISKTAGKDKKPISQEIAYQYGTTEEILEPCWTKNIDQPVLKLKAEAFYYDRKHRPRTSAVQEILVLKEETLKQDRIWARLIEELTMEPTMYDGKTIPEIKSKIAVGYLRQLKAVPRPSDLHRYATSLFYIVKHKLHSDEKATIDWDALVDEYNT